MNSSTVSPQAPPPQVSPSCHPTTIETSVLPRPKPTQQSCGHGKLQASHGQHVTATVGGTDQGTGLRPSRSGSCQPPFYLPASPKSPWFLPCPAQMWGSQSHTGRDDGHLRGTRGATRMWKQPESSRDSQEDPSRWLQHMPSLPGLPASLLPGLPPSLAQPIPGR